MNFDEMPPTATTTMLPGSAAAPFLRHGRCERLGRIRRRFLLDVPVSQPGPSVATEPLSTAIPDDDDRTLPVTADMLDGATEKVGTSCWLARLHGRCE